MDRPDTISVPPTQVQAHLGRGPLLRAAGPRVPRSYRAMIILGFALGLLTGLSLIALALGVLLVQNPY